MSYLAPFTEDQRALLISLPYRTGLWVSESDQGGGAEASQAEIEALEGIITGYSEDFLKSEFVEELMKKTLARKESWKKWADDLDRLPDECEAALDTLNAHLPPKDVLSFRQCLMEIATAVAMAYRELDDSVPLAEKVNIYTHHYIRVVKAHIKKEQPPSLEMALNISRAERNVLARLSHALRLDLEGNPIDSQAVVA